MGKRTNLHSHYNGEVTDRQTSELFFEVELAARLRRELPMTEHVHHEHKGDHPQLEF